MRQVLFTIPVLDVPVHGFGVVLFLTLIACIQLAARMMKRQGGDPQVLYDLVFWVVVPGILGARLFYVIEYWNEFDHPILQFFAIWQGGLVIYGSAMGGLIGFLWFAYRRGLPKLWLLDLIAPALVLGAGLGRFGCLLNGCCYGDPTDRPWAISFPAASIPYHRTVGTGLQSRLGFVPMVGDRRVLLVEPGTDAERQGLLPADEIVAVEGEPVRDGYELREALLTLHFPESATQRLRERPSLALAMGEPFTITVRRDGVDRNLTIQPPRSLRLYPTQIYSAIDGLLLCACLLAYYPFRRFDGEVIAYMAMGYAVTRFLTEAVRFDEPLLADGLTISQNLSLLMFAAGIAVWLVGWRQGARYSPAAAEPVQQAPAPGG